jgi:phage/plasmid-like protein (TIGR03299 family)
MAYANEVPWHGLGVNVPSTATPDEMCQAAGLDWTVSLEQGLVRVPATGELVPVPGQFHLMRSTDGKVLTSCGQRWKPIQNRDVFAFFKRVVEAGNATMETAGSLHGGRVVWALARLGEHFKLPGNDVVRAHVLLVSPHEHGKAAKGRAVATRVVCANTMAMAEGEVGTSFDFSHSHATSFDPELYSVKFELAREEFASFERQARSLKKTRMTWEQVLSVLLPIFQPVEGVEEPTAADELKWARELLEDASKMSPTMKALATAYTEAPGADPGNAWGALNAVTYHIDHSARRDQSRRMASAWMGKGARAKQTVLDSLLALAQ